MAGADANPRARLEALVHGYRLSQAVYAAVELGVPDALVDSPRSIEHLAQAVGADRDALFRLLRALASAGVLDESHDGRFALTPVGEPLVSTAERSLAGYVAFAGSRAHWEAWGALLHTVRTGENAFRSVHGEDVWSYRASRPAESALFDGAMSALTAGVDRAVLDAYDFGSFGTVVDVGGGRGTLLVSILGAHPSVRGVLFDQAHVVADADLGPLAERCRVVAGSFFEEVPAGGDAYLLKSIVHDWEDPEAGALLRVCRRAMHDGARLLLVERDLGAPNEGLGAKLSDLNMLVSAGGRERTLEEYRSLLEQAGLRLLGSHPAAAGLQVIEAAPA